MTAREYMPVYWTEVGGELLLLATTEAQGRLIKDLLCRQDIGNLEEFEKADLWDVPDENVVDWMVEHDIDPEGLAAGECMMPLPKGWHITKNASDQAV